MTDREVLDMPAIRFWAMERRITPIIAEENLREINIGQALAGEDAFNSMRDSIHLCLDDVFKYDATSILEPKRDPNAKAKLLSLR